MSCLLSVSELLLACSVKGCSYFLILSNFASWSVMVVVMLSIFSSWTVIFVVTFFMYFLNSPNMDCIVVVKLVFFTEDEVEEAISSVAVSVEVGSPDRVFVEGYMTRNKYWSGL